MRSLDELYNMDVLRGGLICALFVRLTYLRNYCADLYEIWRFIWPTVIFVSIRLYSAPNELVQTSTATLGIVCQVTY
jgi:hypothetical protein